MLSRAFLGIMLLIWGYMRPLQQKKTEYGTTYCWLAAGGLSVSFVERFDDAKRYWEKEAGEAIWTHDPWEFTTSLWRHVAAMACPTLQAPNDQLTAAVGTARCEPHVLEKTRGSRERYQQTPAWDFPKNNGPLIQISFRPQKLDLDNRTRFI